MPGATSNPNLKALTEWWEEMGVPFDEALIRAMTPAEKPSPEDYRSGKVPDRRAKKRRGSSPQEYVRRASTIAAECTSLPDILSALENYEGSPLKSGAENTVVYDGMPGAPVMIIGEGPGAQEDRKGLPFVGRAGQLLDKMLAAINLSRQTNALITNVNYWRPPGNRDPDTEELAICRPFVDRMIELSAPKLIISLGNIPTKSLLGTRTGIIRMRGTEHMLATPGGHECKLIPMLHPAYLLRRPQEKSRTWRDLLLVEQRLKEMGEEISES